MAIPRVKSTYSLDLETVQALDALARRWGIPKSAALRRIIRSAARELDGASDALAAFDELQRDLDLDRDSADAWAEDVRAERRASRS